MIRTILPIVAVTIAMTGCVSSGTNFDRNFGDANRTLAAQQTRNPSAPVANREKLPDGMDGRSAREALACPFLLIGNQILSDLIGQIATS